MAACGGGRNAQPSHTARPPDRPPPRRPGRAYAAAPGRTHHANAGDPPPGETDGRSEASAAPHKSTKFLVLCASVRPGSQNANFVDLVSGAAPPSGAIQLPGVGGPRPPLRRAPALDLWGGTTTPPHGRCVTCAVKKSLKKVSHSGRCEAFYLVFANKSCENQLFWWFTPPPSWRSQKRQFAIDNMAI